MTNLHNADLSSLNMYTYVMEQRAYMLSFGPLALTTYKLEKSIANI